MKKLIISLLVTLISGSANAWDGSGTETDPWLIKTVEDMNIWATNSETNDYEGKFFKLYWDVNYGSGEYLMPIKTFAGTFDGNNKTLGSYEITDNNPALTGDALNNIGIFRELKATAIVMNLKIGEGCDYIGGSCVGGIAAENKGTISGCINSCNVVCGGASDSYAGGIAGKNSGTITNCEVRNKVTGDGAYIGGIAGINTGTITNCTNKGEVAGGASTSYVGGVIGYGICSSCTNSGAVSGGNYVGGIANNNTPGVGTFDLENNENTGVVSGVSHVGGICGLGSPKECINRGAVTATGDYVGGISGKLRAKDCENYGDVTSTKTSSGNTYIGGIVGQGEAYGCTNHGDVENNWKVVGGIAGEGTHIEDCVNNGTITGKLEMGGIAGHNRSTSGVVKNCINNGEVIGTGSEVGGIVGNSWYQSSITDCINNANVTGSSFVGGIVGVGGKTGEDNYITLSGCTVEKGTITAPSGGGAIAGMIYDASSTYCHDNHYYQSVILVKGSDTFDGATARGVGGVAGTWGLQDIATSDGAVMIPLSAQTITITTADGETVKTDITTNVTDEANKEVEVISAGIPVSEAGSSDVAIPSSVTIGSTVYQVTSIAPNSFAGKTEIENIYLPETDTKLTLGANALKIDDTNVATIHTSLALLDDYATDAVLDQNLVAGKVQTTVTPANQYWTFACGVDVEVPDGVSVYICKINGSEVEITELTADQLTVGGKKIIKANNGVLIASTAGNPYNIIASKNPNITTVATTDVKSYGEENALVPVIVSQNYDPASYYMLYQGKFVAIEAGDLTETPACKALLKK